MNIEDFSGYREAAKRDYRKLLDRIAELEAENLAQAATIKKAELLAAHLQELNSAIMENVNKAMEICRGK